MTETVLSRANTPGGILIPIHPTKGFTLMCSAITCRRCGKTSWTGCGQHVDQVMRGIPQRDRCQGHESEPGLLSRLFSRS